MKADVSSAIRGFDSEWKKQEVWVQEHIPVNAIVQVTTVLDVRGMALSRRMLAVFDAQVQERVEDLPQLSLWQRLKAVFRPWPRKVRVELWRASRKDGTPLLILGTFTEYK